MATRKISRLVPRNQHVLIACIILLSMSDSVVSLFALSGFLILPCQAGWVRFLPHGIPQCYAHVLQLLYSHHRHQVSEHCDLLRWRCYIGSLCRTARRLAWPKRVYLLLCHCHSHRRSNPRSGTEHWDVHRWPISCWGRYGYRPNRCPNTRGRDNTRQV